MFDENFRVCFADTPFGVALHQRIRYQVFCLERGFEDPGAFSTAQETDAWDDQSAHFIVQNKNTQQWVAATRIVLPKRGHPLPVDTLGAFDRSCLEDPYAPVSEISRFCIISNRTVNTGRGDGLLDPNSLEAWGIGAVGSAQQFEVTIGMIRTLVVFILKRNLTYCVFLVTDAFARLLTKLGLNLRQVGAPIEHRGMRTAYVIDMRETAILMSRKSSRVRDMYRRSRRAYMRMSSVMAESDADVVSEFSPDHSLFNETVFLDTVMQSAEADSDLRVPSRQFEMRSAR